MMLGELLDRLDDDAVAEQTLLSLGDLGLVARVKALADQNGETVGETLAAVVGAFLGTAGSDAWMATMTAASRSDEPGTACLKIMIEEAFANRCGPSCTGQHAHS